MKRLLLDNLKNIPGWRTSDKLVVFAVDDYGNVRLDSPRARDQLSEAGLDMSSRFDQYDALGLNALESADGDVDPTTE